MLKKNLILILLIILYGFMCVFLGVKINQSNYAVSDGYYFEEGLSFMVPEGWQKTTELGPLAFINMDEDNGESTFRSYIFFLSEELNGRTSEQYYNYIKSRVESVSENYELLEEKDENGKHIIVTKTDSEGASYVIAMAIAEGLADNYWVISLNTLEEDWPQLEPIFYETIDSFKLR